MDDNLKRYSLPSIPKEYNAYISYSGFRIDEAKSAMQKCIRRSNIEAIQWGLEMYWSFKANRTCAWNRLFIIAVEDIGPAHPYALIHLQKLRTNDNEENFVRAIQLLVNSKKTRVSDWCLHIPIPKLEGEIEDLIQSCIAYKEEGNFSCSLYCLVNITKHKVILHLFNFYKLVFPTNAYTKEILRILQKWNKVDLYILTIATLFHLWFFNCLPTNIPDELEKLNVMDIVESYQGRRNLVGIPDIAVDKHTEKGRRMKRGFSHFLKVGGLLTNVDPVWEELDSHYVSEIHVK